MGVWVKGWYRKCGTITLPFGCSLMELSFSLSLLFDLVLLCVIGGFIFAGARKGTIPTFLSFIILCIAYPLACFLFPKGASLFDQKTTERMLNDTVAFATVLVCLYLLMI